jgi:short-subunit dehydrogenase
MTQDARPVVLLTGAAHGIGRATALALGARGYRLGLIDRDAPALGSVVRELWEAGVRAEGQAADVCDDESLKSAVAALEGAVGPTDVLVTCAGVGTMGTVTDLDIPGFRRMLEVNVLGVAQSIEAVLPGMFARGRGHIVGVSSVTAFRGMPWMPGYAASKAAVANYLEGLRPGLAKRGVTVTTVYPGLVRTAMTVDTPFRKPPPWLEPEQAAAYLVRAVERRPRDYCFPPSTALGFVILRRLPGRLFDRLMGFVGSRALTTDL